MVNQVASRGRPGAQMMIWIVQTASGLVTRGAHIRLFYPWYGRPCSSSLRRCKNMATTEEGPMTAGQHVCTCGCSRAEAPGLLVWLPGPLAAGQIGGLLDLQSHWQRSNLELAPETVDPKRLD